jgi:hypothetical protein
MVAFLRAVAPAVVVGVAPGAAGQTASDLQRWVVALGVLWLGARKTACATRCATVGWRGA